MPVVFIGLIVCNKKPSRVFLDAERRKRYLVLVIWSHLSQISELLSIFTMPERK